MRRIVEVLCMFPAVLMGVAQMGVAQAAPYKVLSATKVGGDGGYDYVYADSPGRKLYVPRLGPAGKIMVFDLDTLKPVGEIAANAHGVAVAAGHGFSSSKPVAIWDAATLAPITKIDVLGGPDGILADTFNDRVYVFSHEAPNATVIDARTGKVLGTIDLGGEPEQAVSDGKGHLYVDLEDKDKIAVVDAATMKVTGTYGLAGKGGGCAGLAIDVANGVLFASCREPQTMVILKASDGTVLTSLPIGKGSDGATFNPATMEAFSSQGDGTLTVVKAASPTSFSLEQTVTTMPRARTLTLDAKTGHIILVSAEFGAAPPLLPGQRYSRPPMVPGTFTVLVVGK